MAGCHCCHETLHFSIGYEDEPISDSTLRTSHLLSSFRSIFRHPQPKLGTRTGKLHTTRKVTRQNLPLHRQTYRGCEMQLTGRLFGRFSVDLRNPQQACPHFQETSEDLQKQNHKKNTDVPSFCQAERAEVSHLPAQPHTPPAAAAAPSAGLRTGGWSLPGRLLVMLLQSVSWLSSFPVSGCSS